MGVAGAIGVVILLLLFYVGISAIVAYQARKRGYNFWVWLVGGCLGNPLFFLVLLGVMPNFARSALRRRFLAELEEKLALVPREVYDAVEVVPDDEPLATPERSLGDRSTDLPERSLGDEETRA